MDINFIKMNDDELKKKPNAGDALGFGKLFSDYMFTMKYYDNAWHDAQISKYENFSLAPSTIVFHYAQEIFEGMKSYCRNDNSIGLFRADMNFNRFNRSAVRMCMPEVPVEIHEKGLKELLKIERDWFPETQKGTMYIRPTMIATDEMLGVKESSTYTFFIILSPSGFYFSKGPQPVKVYVSDQYVRAVAGGVGEAKTGGNYAASLLAGKVARDLGCDQVLWLDAKENKYIEEVGAMNIWFVYGNKIVTSELSGAILQGVTRDSVLKLGKHLGYEVVEKKLAIEDIINDIESGKLTECFGCGTAAVISPVGEFHYKGKAFKITDEIGKVSKLLYDELTGIQWGTKEDAFGWTEIVK